MVDQTLGASQPSGTAHLKSYHKTCIWLGQVAGIVNAAVAGIGVGTGLLDPASGILAGYVVPITMGVAIAVLLAIGWHILQVQAARVRRPLGYVGVVGGGGGLAGLAILISSAAIATALSGHTALNRYMHEWMAGTQITYNTITSNATNEVAMQPAVKAAADQLRAMVKSEEGGMLTGKEGHGPVSKVLEAAAGRFDELAAGMDKPIAEMRKLSAEGDDLVQEMQSLIGNDAKKFEKDAVTLQAIASKISAFRLTDRAKDVEAINAAFGIDNAKATINTVTATVLKRAAELDDARKPVIVPSFTPIEAREAIKLYWNSAALGGWLTGIGADTIPYLFVLLTLCTAKEPMMHRIKPAPPPRMGDDPRETDPDGTPPDDFTPQGSDRSSILGTDDHPNNTDPDGPDETVTPFRMHKKQNPEGATRS